VKFHYEVVDYLFYQIIKLNHRSTDRLSRQNRNNIPVEVEKISQQLCAIAAAEGTMLVKFQSNQALAEKGTGA